MSQPIPPSPSSRLRAGHWFALALILLALSVLSWWLKASPDASAPLQAATSLPAMTANDTAPDPTAPSPIAPPPRASAAPVQGASIRDISTASHPSAAVEVARPAPPAWLPRDALATLARIRAGGPFPFRKDGSVFDNRERRLPLQPRGRYREYTVSAPGSRDRGARRIVCTGDPPRQCWCSRDHYRSFRRIPDDLLAATR